MVNPPEPAPRRATATAAPDRLEVAPDRLEVAPDRLEVLQDGRPVDPPRAGRAADLDAARARAWWAGFSEQVRTRTEELTELDRLAGDGDFGDNLRSAVRGADKRLELEPPDSVSGVFDAVTLAFLDTGGTSGPLFGMWFREFARAAGQSIGTDGLAQAANAGLATVQRLGGAAVGDKTMVDAMAPAAQALSDAAAAGVPAVAALGAAYRAAADGARATDGLRARRGRASYVGDLARGVVDPGALAVAWFFERGTAV